MKTYTLKIQTTFQYWTSQHSIIEVEAPREIDMEMKLDEMHPGDCLKNELFSFEILSEIAS